MSDDLREIVEGIIDEFSEYAYDGDVLSLGIAAIAQGIPSFDICRGDICATGWIQAHAGVAYNREEVRGVLRDIDRKIDKARVPWSQMNNVLASSPPQERKRGTIMFGGGIITTYSPDRVVGVPIKHAGIAAARLNGEKKLDEAMERVLKKFAPDQVIVCDFEQQEMELMLSKIDCTPLPQGFMHRWAIHEIEDAKIKRCDCTAADCSDENMHVSIGRELVVIDLTYNEPETKIQIRYAAAVT